MLSLIPDATVSLGVLGTLCTAMALRMSMYRLDGSPGDGVPFSPLTCFYDHQILTSEWAGIGGPLIVGLMLKSSVPREWTNALAAIFVLSRVVFASRVCLSPPKGKGNHKPYFYMGFPSMIVTYLSCFAMGALLIKP